MLNQENYLGVYQGHKPKAAPKTITCVWSKPYRVIRIVHSCGNVTMYYGSNSFVTKSAAEEFAKERAGSRGQLGESFAVLDLHGIGPAEITCTG